MFKNENLIPAVVPEESQNPQIKEEEEELCIQENMDGVIAVTVKKEEVEENHKLSHSYQCHTVGNRQECGGPPQRRLMMKKKKKLSSQPRGKFESQSEDM